jgi:hypothetical protein
MQRSLTPSHAARGDLGTGSQRAGWVEEEPGMNVRWDWGWGVAIWFVWLALAGAVEGRAATLEAQRLLENETFWDNRDWEWYRSNIPFFECPDAELVTTYYYRWELVTKHLTYGSPESGYSYTEFIDRPFWSGAYGAISCPAGHQLYEVRWLRDRRYSQDYARYWLRTPGAEPRRYSTWLADSVWALSQVQGDAKFVRDLYPDLVRNQEAWDRDHFVPEKGLYWQTGHDDGMEFNINSRQTRNIFRGAPGYRPTINAYMWAELRALAEMAEFVGETYSANEFRERADALKDRVQSMLWDPRRQFFFPMFRDDEVCHEEHFPGFTIRAGTLTYEDGPFAGSPHGRELIGFVPWQFKLPGPGYEAAWRFLMDPEFFLAPFGPTTVERHDPQFLVTDRCCWWSGQSWPYATTQTLKALAHLLQDYAQDQISRAEYLTLLGTYARTHRKEGRPYLAEAAHPDTGSWEGYDAYNHSEHYFHSGFNDLIITGLVGVKPRADDMFDLDPLASPEWPWFALDALPYRGHRVGIFWDRDGSRYGLGRGLHVIVNGEPMAWRETLGRLTFTLPSALPVEAPARTPVNYAVNNDGQYYPRLTASFTARNTALSRANDGNYWYHLHPPNRWTTEGSPHAKDWIAVDFGLERTVHTVKLYLLDDGNGITPPNEIDLEFWTGQEWERVPEQRRQPVQPTGRRANHIVFPEMAMSRLRAVLTHEDGTRSGLSEFEVWGDALLPVARAPMPAGNLAVNLQGEGYPKARASFTSRFDRVEEVNDGIIQTQANPRNRWTAYESPNARDWLEIDFGQEREISRMELVLYDDRGGVRAPAGYRVEHWTGSEWKEVGDAVQVPAIPAGNEINTVSFNRIRTSKVRVVFEHAGSARSGLTEILIWNE